VQFSGKNLTVMLLSDKSQCEVTLSLNKSIFRFDLFIFVFKSFSQELNIDLFILALSFQYQLMPNREGFNLPKHLGCLALPITKGGNFSLSKLEHSKTVILYLANFPPWHFSSRKANVLLGKA
jgi:hypothetical protein